VHRRAERHHGAPGGRSKVLLLIKCLGYGGAERLLVDMAACGDRARFEYEVAYVLRDEHGLVPAMEATGTPVHALGARGNWDLAWTVALRHLLRQGRYEVVHLHLPYAAGLGRLVARTLPRRWRPQLVYTEHSMWPKTEMLVRILNRATIGLDDALIVVSESARDALPAALRARARVVVHGIDPDESDELLARRDAVRKEVRAELGATDGELLVVTVANLRREKGYDVLLEAARRVMTDGAAIRFAAVGRGPMADELEAAHRALGLGERFRFLGQRSDARRLLAGADVFVLTSHHEGLPVALMEATSVGIPIVATRVGEIPRVLEDGTDALLVDPGRPDAVADALVRLAKDPLLRDRLGRAARTRSASFDIASATRTVEALYTELLDRPR
jgi:glycosyltransferase involved in cell wall biosynthesis